jgi:hypothetical protein
MAAATGLAIAQQPSGAEVSVTPREARTFVRVTLGQGYERPVYIHILADHYRPPWYEHLSLGQDGATAALEVKPEAMLAAGERTVWCDLTPILWNDSGAMLYISARHAYTEPADRLRAVLEFATAPDDKAVVRTLTFDQQPSGMALYVPPHLLTAENVARLRTARDIAGDTGRFADAYAWPTHGKKPQRFPFFVTADLKPFSIALDAITIARERKTLEYFGFTDSHLRHIGGVWHLQHGSYCQPDLAMMKTRAAEQAAAFRRDGGKVEEIVFCELIDEPTGQPLEVIAADSFYRERFRDWLKASGKTPAELLVDDWQGVKLVTGQQRRTYPALYYYSQRFRTRALGDFMATQRTILESTYGRRLPTVANFSDGVIYRANFYEQGVDYFELLEAPDQNAIWGEDWANGASTYQCAAFNVDLMRAAARVRGQVIGHHLIAHDGRTPWDVKLKATSELARGVKILNNFHYGPSWATHEGGPYWRTHVWQAKPETWSANAALTREVGAVEDMLLTAMPAPAKVALLYSSASDAWTIEGNLAYGFDRMHTWLALAHAQMPVDILGESQVAAGLLDGYQVCYLFGPNLTRAAAEKIGPWVQRGGVLWLSAGAGVSDEYDRPLAALAEMLPAERGEIIEWERYTSSGRYLATLAAKDQVRWSSGGAAVLAVRQSLKPLRDATVLATFQDASPALVRGSVGKGTIYCAGFLPALAYIQQALDARNVLLGKVKTGAALSPLEQREALLLERSYNPWRYPASLRDLLLMPIRAAGVEPPITCSVPLVDAVFMKQEKGVLIALANYTLEPIRQLTLAVRLPHPIAQARSARCGPLSFQQTSSTSIELPLPLDENDFIELIFE